MPHLTHIRHWRYGGAHQLRHTHFNYSAYEQQLVKESLNSLKHGFGIKTDLKIPANNIIQITMKAIGLDLAY